MPNDPEFMRKKYSELALGLILIDVLEADEQGITVHELVARRVADQAKQGHQHSETTITSQPTSSFEPPPQQF